MQARFRARAGVWETGFLYPTLSNCNWPTPSATCGKKGTYAQAKGICEYICSEGRMNHAFNRQGMGAFSSQYSFYSIESKVGPKKKALHQQIINSKNVLPCGVKTRGRSS